MTGLVLAAILGSLVPGPAGAVDVVRAGCPDAPAYYSCTWPGTSTIYWSPAAGREELLHELGHQFDYDDMTDGDRAAFEAINGDPRPWRSPPNSPHEQFAEAYRLCAMYRRLPEDRYVNYDLSVGPKRFKRMCRIIRIAART